MVLGLKFKNGERSRLQFSSIILKLLQKYLADHTEAGKITEPDKFLRGMESIEDSILKDLEYEKSLQDRVGDLDGVAEAVYEELLRAEGLHGQYPESPFKGLAIIGEEFGELSQAALNWEFKGEPAEDLREAMLEEAAQVAATAIRFILAYRKIEKP